MLSVAWQSWQQDHEQMGEIVKPSTRVSAMFLKASARLTIKEKKKQEVSIGRVFVLERVF